MNERSIFSTAVSIILPATIFLTIIGFAPMTPNYFATFKHVSLISAAAILVIVWGISNLSSRTITAPRARILLPLLLFIGAIAINMVVNKNGWFEALISRGSIYIAGAIVSVMSLLVKDKEKIIRYSLYSFIASCFILAFHGLAQLTFLHQIESLPDYMNARAFTLTGSPLVTFTMLVLGSSVTFLYASRSLKNSLQYMFFLAGTLQTIAAVAYLSLLLPGNELAPVILPYQVSWSIALDALKTGKSILFGIGLANFSELLAAVRPASLNTTPYWSALPTSSGSEILHLLTTTGITGLGTFIMTILIAVAKGNSKESLVMKLIVVGSILALALTPVSIPVVTILFIAIGLSARSEVHEVNTHPYTPRIAGVIAIIAATYVGYYGIRLYQAENHMFKAQKAFANNDAKTVYDEHIAAIKLAPRVMSYRMSYAQVNLTLAGALSQKQDLSESEREQATVLIQQAIREAKTAASLRPYDSKSWQNLGNIYRNLINVAEGADQFSVSSYAQAVALDPGNPILRLEFGGLLYQLAGIEKDTNTKNALLTRAVQEFQTAVQLKPDYANAYFNLSKVLESVGNIQAAYSAMQKAVASLDPTSSDLAKATAELEALKAKLPKPSPSPSASSSNSPTPSPSADSSLSQPSPLPSPIAGGPINLPEESPLPPPTQ